MKLKKFKIIKTLALMGTAGVLVATPIIATSCSTSSKKDLSVNQDLNVVGNISNIINQQGNLDLETYLANNADKFINGYNEQTDGKVSVSISNFENKNDKWGKTPYEEWRKLSSGKPEKTESDKNAFNFTDKDNKLDIQIYEDNRMTISSWNDLFDQLNKMFDEANDKNHKPSSGENQDSLKAAEPSRPYFYVDSKSALGFDNNNSTLHVKVDAYDKEISNPQGKQGEDQTETQSKLLGSFDLSIPMAYIIFKIENINLKISGEKINPISTTIKSLTCDFTVKSNLSYEINEEIIIDKDLQTVTVAPTANSVMVALGWAKYSKIDSPTPLENDEGQSGGSTVNPTDKDIDTNQQAIWNDLKVSGIHFSTPKLTQNENKTYKLELEMDLNNNLKWDDNKEGTKTFVLDNLKLVTRTAILSSTEKDYSSTPIQIEDLSKVEEYIRKNIDKITDSIQKDLTKLTSSGEQLDIKTFTTTQSPILLNGTIALNKDKTIESNKGVKQEADGNNGKTIKLVYDVNANAGTVFFDDNSKQKQITITLKFTKKVTEASGLL